MVAFTLAYLMSPGTYCQPVLIGIGTESEMVVFEAVPEIYLGKQYQIQVDDESLLVTLLSSAFKFKPGLLHDYPRYITLTQRAWLSMSTRNFTGSGQNFAHPLLDILSQWA